MATERSLDIPEEPEFHRREWRLQRIGWVVLGLVAAAALAGAFGKGPLAHAEAMSAEGTVHVAYERIARVHSPVRLEFTLAPGLAGADGRVRLWLDRRYAEQLEITGVQPEPAEVSVTPTLLVYHFAVSDGGRPVRVTFAVEHDRAGPVRSAAGVLPQGTVELGQYVFP